MCGSMLLIKLCAHATHFILHDMPFVCNVQIPLARLKLLDKYLRSFKSLLISRNFEIELTFWEAFKVIFDNIQR